MNKNYVATFHEIINNLDYRPKLLFHVCCGVCSAYPLLLLDKYFDITIYYVNDNIYPDSEYDHRLSELERYLNLIKEKHSITLIVPKRNEKEHLKQLTPFAQQKEGLQRCLLCYNLRLSEAYKYASEHNYEYCSSVMSISNHKRADYINDSLYSLSLSYPNVKPLIADLKKEDGIIINEKINKIIKLYRQNYCGCPFSMRKNNKF